MDEVFVSHRAGEVAIVGRPNVGKSTLLNALVGAKVAIVTPKPQTTRTRVVGIRTLPDAQIVFVDTPGIHPARSPLNLRMVAVAEEARAEADVVLLVVDASAGVTPADRELAEVLARGRATTIAVLNKRDRVRPAKLLPMMAALGECLPGREVIPVSARTGENVDTVLKVAAAALPEGPRLHPEDEYTTAPARFLAQELVREQLFLATDEEIPYGTAVEVEEYREEPARGLVAVRATILVAREGHKGIVIGVRGERLREIGTRARGELERLLGTRVFLELFVRVEPGWATNPRRLRELGL
jgi:GTP-binding protein Era